MKYAGLLAITLAACGIERRPPTLAITRNPTAAPVHRAILLPSECSTQTCKGLDAIVAAELAFRGIEIVDLDRLAAVERTRSEVDVSSTTAVNGVASATTHRRVEVHGPLLSDVDVWTLRDELVAMNVDAVVRVRTATITASPPRVVALVRMTRASDASLVWSSSCEIEPPTLSTDTHAADTAVRCALKGVAP